MTAAPDWIAIDWGTSNLRGWLMAGDRVLDHRQSDRGMGRLTRADFEPALADLTAGWPHLPVIACGMVGARQGWVEAPYAMTPTPPVAAALTRAPSAAFDVRIIPGVAQDRPADVMRGEETQIAGFLRLNPDWDGTLVLPGTHNKWVQISAGEIVSFRTFMTGELFAALTTHTVLRHSTGGNDWDDAAFDAGLRDGLTAPEQLSARLFSIRSESLLHGEAPGTARARLSGLLIGAELAAARGWWLGARIAVIGAGRVADAYVRALTAQGAAPETADNDAVTLAGLAAAREATR